MPYYFQADVISRGKGDSIVAKAAYNHRPAITEERTGELKDYIRHRDKPMASFVFAPDPELKDSASLWNFYDAQETRANAQLGMSFKAALPHQLTDEQREFIVKTSCASSSYGKESERKPTFTGPTATAMSGIFMCTCWRACAKSPRTDWANGFSPGGPAEEPCPLA